MFEVRLDRSYYSISDKIFKHLKEMFGEEVYSYTVWEGHEGSEESPYTVRQDFGYTTVSFKKEEDLKTFKDWVEAQ